MKKIGNNNKREKHEELKIETMKYQKESFDYSILFSINPKFCDIKKSISLLLLLGCVIRLLISV